MGVIQGGSIIDTLRLAGFVIQPEANVYVVDPNVSAFTFQNAIDLCVAGNGDFIVALPGTHDITTTVLFNKSGVTVVAPQRGLSPFKDGEFNVLFANASFTDGPVAKISAPTAIFGMGFVSRDTGALFFAGAALLIGGDALANPFGAHIKRCRFPKWGLSNRIGISVEGSSDCLIEECDFEGVGADFSAGIYVQGATQNLTIRNNHFRQCTAAVKYGQFADTQEPHIFIERNIVEDGLILDSQGNTASGFVYDNFSELAADSSYDSVVGTLIAQGIKIAGNHYTET